MRRRASSPHWLQRSLYLLFYFYRCTLFESSTIFEFTRKNFMYYVLKTRPPQPNPARTKKYLPCPCLQGRPRSPPVTYADPLSSRRLAAPRPLSLSPAGSGYPSPPLLAHSSPPSCPRPGRSLFARPLAPNLRQVAQCFLPSPAESPTDARKYPLYYLLS